MPKSAGIPARVLARRSPGGAPYGRTPRALVSGLLLGPDGGSVRAGGDEHRLDGGGGGFDRRREGASVAPRGDVGDRGHPPGLGGGSGRGAAQRPRPRG